VRIVRPQAHHAGRREQARRRVKKETGPAP
jgi:hypothetical protein